MLENKLVAGLDIDLSTYSLGIIKQPTIKQLIELPFDDSDITYPFIAIEQYYSQAKEYIEENKSELDFSRMDCLNPLEMTSKSLISEEYDRDIQINYRDVFIERKKRYSFLEIYFLVLSLFFDCSISDFYINNINGKILITIKDKAIIDEHNIEVLNKVILKYFKIDIDSLLEKKEDDWIENTGSKREKELIKKFKDKERKRREKSILHLCDYINIVVHQDKRNYLDILNWTYFQLISTIEISRLKQSFDIGMRILTTGKGLIKTEDIVDWQKESKLKIDNSIY
ncbi:Uncharacterised protein [Peptostreptococcus anaerobius]|uniref:Uncharacterized protein n=1 Tax=Peptostreptococcus anaerobius TaxID=1261 RepID=A0A379CCW2_9FIRM|nr:hypothetical protein [Peptostreptococcus anaerobius]SFM87008.1 hypothetical protein SAMN05660467_00648 [Peptostreptococcus anaerobius]SUB60163.1 Uncharacterised protein [Peptostreptococcus anaerobius]SUB62152.1 Uncharacterised protein [Peptostreptococcus anaerobius]